MGPALLLVTGMEAEEMGTELRENWESAPLRGRPARKEGGSQEV